MLHAFFTLKFMSRNCYYCLLFFRRKTNSEDGIRAGRGELCELSWACRQGAGEELEDEDAEYGSGRAFTWIFLCVLGVFRALF